MKINICKTVDLDFDAEITVEDVLDDFSNMISDFEHGVQHDVDARLLIPTLDYMTRMLARIPDSTIAMIPQHAVNVIAQRLSAEALRWSRRYET
jgi:hypothetical protein